MSERRVDRAAWARVIAQLIDQEAGGNKAGFARLAGISSTRNVDRWLTEQVNVSEESVRQVARAFKIPVFELLVEIGFLRPDEVAPQAPPAVDNDPAIELVQNSDAPPSLKRELIAHLMKQREEQEKQRVADAQRMLDLARRSRRTA